jgi:hypothetical protein
MKTQLKLGFLFELEILVGNLTEALDNPNR